MRRVVAILAISVATIVVVDFAAPAFNGFEPGSVGIEPQTVNLEVIPFDPDWDDPACAEPDWTAAGPCPRRYAFRAGGTLTVWFSVRNAGPLPINLLGVSDAWIEQFTDIVPLARPTTGLDGGDSSLGVPELVGVPFEPVRLSPGGERLLGLEFVTTADLRHACEHWSTGGGIGWDSAPVSWSLIGFKHEEEMAFTPVTFMAPIAEDCA